MLAARGRVRDGKLLERRRSERGGTARGAVVQMWRELRPEIALGDEAELHRKLLVQPMRQSVRHALEPLQHSQALEQSARLPAAGPVITRGRR